MGADILSKHQFVLGMINYDFYEMIVEFLEREERYFTESNFGKKNVTSDLDGSYDASISSCDMSDDRKHHAHYGDNPGDRLVCWTKRTIRLPVIRFCLLEHFFNIEKNGRVAGRPIIDRG